MIFFLAGGAQRGHRAAVERTEGRENLEAALAVLVTPLARELYGSLVGFGSGVSQKHLAISETSGQALHQTRAGLGMKHVGDMGELLGLLLDRTHHTRMLMAEAGDCEPTEEIQVTIAFSIVEIRAFATDKRERKASINIDHVGVGGFDDFGAVHLYL